ncbi:MAG: hypothetical protein LBK76_08705 [Verrucomicrobiales bacterium]|jgi:DNA-binding GntR family transcriptional regulator|nr:hypothetical protein [Verrucomicrobiales bacterium]
MKTNLNRSAAGTQAHEQLDAIAKRLRKGQLAHLTNKQFYHTLAQALGNGYIIEGLAEIALELTAENKPGQTKA